MGGSQHKFGRKMDESLFTQNCILKQTLNSTRKQIKLLEVQIENERKTATKCSDNKTEATLKTVQTLVKQNHEYRKIVSKLENEVLELKSQILSMKLKQSIKNVEDDR